MACIATGTDMFGESIYVSLSCTDKNADYHVCLEKLKPRAFSSSFSSFSFFSGPSSPFSSFFSGRKSEI